MAKFVEKEFTKADAWGNIHLPPLEGETKGKKVADVGLKIFADKYAGPTLLKWANHPDIDTNVDYIDCRMYINLAKKEGEKPAVDTAYSFLSNLRKIEPTKQEEEPVVNKDTEELLF